MYKKYTHTHYQNKKRRGLSCTISARKLSYPRRRPWFVTHTDTCNHDCKLRGLWKKLFRIQDFNSVFIIQLFIIQDINTLIITGFFSYFYWQILLAINSEITKKNVAKYMAYNLCGSRKQRNFPFKVPTTYICTSWESKNFRPRPCIPLTLLPVSYRNTDTDEINGLIMKIIIMPVFLLLISFHRSYLTFSSSIPLLRVQCVLDGYNY